jgi:hypothetical protein
MCYCPKNEFEHQKNGAFWPPLLGVVSKKSADTCEAGCVFHTPKTCWID